ncbi:unnamed protein product [Arabis nemorensis]|uniref:Uncharacterized protein n=1 Tax=Arabis nemorensis TaxID=586526 RepID=A0A565CA46_9BRAS|nr:unnamed protein product [Arabis nemorensis]
MEPWIVSDRDFTVRHFFVRRLRTEAAFKVLLRNPTNENVIPGVEELQRRLPIGNHGQGQGKESSAAQNDRDAGEEDGTTFPHRLCMMSLDGEHDLLRLRMDGLFKLKEHAVQLTKEFTALYTNGPTGGGGISTGHKMEIILEKRLVTRVSVSVMWKTGLQHTQTSESETPKHHSPVAQEELRKVSEKVYLG